VTHTRRLGLEAGAPTPSLVPMGRMVYWMNVSIDLFIEATPDVGAAGDWLRIGEELHHKFNRRAGNLAAARVPEDGHT
jgi:hypothetical protein